MNKRGVVLILTFIVIIVLTILGLVVISRSISESRITQRYVESAQAFWLAEAGANKALDGLRNNYGLTSVAKTSFPLGQDQGYSANISANIDGSRTVTAYGFIPFNSPFRAERSLEVVMNKLLTVPSNFYDNVIYTGGDLVTTGQPTINGTVYNADILPLLNFEQLRIISQNQGNYHDISQLDGPFPTSFWYNEVAHMPNVIFLEGNLDLSGNQDHVAGFYVVGGEFIFDATINGNASVDGAVYTRGNFTINGGGNAPFNINGGVWSGSQTTLHGSSVIVTYNEVYMNAIKGLGIDTDVQIISWKDQQKPYQLQP